MGSKNLAQYDAPHQFEPLLPDERSMGPLLERASDLSRAATTLGSGTALAAQSHLRELLRAMNSFYTNRLEGEHTRPGDIERALQQDFSSNRELARKQRLAVAHIDAERHLEAVLDARMAAGDDVRSWLYSMQAVTELHARIFKGLPKSDLKLSDGTSVAPGVLRKRAVAVGRHEAPVAASVPRFIDRWGDVYGRVRRGEASLIALAAAHHRLAWVHPFLDGNGRTVRLHTHLGLRAMGLSQGLWSPLRAFARTEERYKALLQAADEPRRGDLDGRGNLTQAGLVEWIGYTLDVCIDQVTFMRGLLDVERMRDRISAALAFDEIERRTGVRREAVMPLHYLFATQGELARADFKTMLGLGDRVTSQVISALLRQGYLTSSSAYGPLRFAVPRHALRFYFPMLWPEAEQDAWESSRDDGLDSRLH